MKRFRVFIFLFFILIYLFIFTEQIYSFRICIFGLAINLSILSVNIFIKSLHETNYKGTLILFLSDKYKIEYLNYSFSFRIILIETKWPYYSPRNVYYHLKYNYLTSCMIPNYKYHYKWNIYRYSIINCWLMEYFKKFDFYFLLDVRDTLFQLNVEMKSYKNAVYLSEDARHPFRFKDDIYNNRWLNVYIKNSSIQYNTPLNSGTVYGSNKEFSSFIKLYVEFIKSKYINTAEQGTLNYLYYSGFFNRIPIIINKNDNGVIYNMGIEVIYKKFYKYATYNIHNFILYRYPSYNIPYIVHQYDRDKKYLNFIKHKYEW